MKLRSMGAALVATAALVGTTFAPAHAATEADHTSDWLAGQLDGNLYHGEYGASYGPSLDVALALAELGDPATATDVVNAVAAQWEAYTAGISGGEWDDAPGSVYAGSTGKLATLIGLAGGDPSNSFGANHIERLEARVGDDGRATDSSNYGDYSNGIGQTWVVRALANAESGQAQAAADFLIDSQCADGLFPTYFADTCEGGIDTTAYAILALRDAIDAGLTGLDDDLAEAVAGLIDAQNPDGSFGADGTTNSNSTGLAAYALRSEGQDAAADAATDWVRTVYVTPQIAADSELTDEVGAIAFSAAAFADGKDDGIADAATRDQWLIATSQAALAFAGNSVDLPDAEQPPADPTITHPGSVKAGAAFDVTGSGFTAGAPVTIDLTIGDAPAGTASSLFRIEIVATVTADASGNIATTLTAPTTAGNYTLTLSDGNISVNSVLTVTAVDAGTGGNTDAGTGTGAGTDASNANLPQTGSEAQPWWLAASVLLLAAGVAIVGVGRRFARVGA